MGLKINKAIGYGLDDLQDITLNDYSRFDSRLTRHPSEVIDYLWENEMAPADFLHYVESYQPKGVTEYIELALLKSRYSEHKITDMVVYECEFGITSVLLFKPLGYTDWHRWWDPIDYVEEHLRVGSAAEPRVERYPYPHYPFESFINARTGEALKGQHVHQVLMLSRMQHEDGIEWTPRAAEEMGFESLQDMRENLRPQIPLDIQLLCRWLDIFKEEATIRRLRPLFYVWWA